MATCIICGTSVDGRVCDLHEEDVVFEFRGTQPDELTPRRYYRGTVDGYAEFGIFVDIGDSVTGLLHKSELNTRLDSMDLEPGDMVFVQVQNVRDNGNVDLGWSIRQDESQFRGTLIDDPDAETDLLAEEVDDEDDEGDTDDSESTDPEPVETESVETASEPAQESASEETPEQLDTPGVTVDELDDYVGDRVRIEGEVATARQTSGPTIFELRDETGTVDCAAFEEAGVRAYPDAGEGDVVRIEGEVERRRGELQVETEALVVLEDEEREEVTGRMRDALVERARPSDVEPLAEDPAVEAVLDDVKDAATAVRRAVLEGRPVVVRHAATVDGYVAGAAIERAALPLIREEHAGTDAEYHYFDRRPLEDAVYSMDDATNDVTTMLSNNERHGEQFPLFVFVATGGTAESLDGFDLLDVYGARRVVIDERAIDSEVAEAVDVLVGPDQHDGPATTATALGANVAAHVNEDVRADLGHLPAVSYWEGTPDQYGDLAAAAGYDADDTRTLREAIALEAFYQSYEDKRELIIDLLFSADASDPAELATHISEQYRTRMDDELDTAEANLERRDRDGETVLVLDTDAYTHRFEFPPTQLLLDELFRRHREDCIALVGIDEDEAYIRTDEDVDIRDLVATAQESAPLAALDARGAREGRVEFLRGERKSAQEALLDALAGVFSASAPA
ncbi:RecJ-like exonuclease, contains DnaJ-type Zn finger domain [Halovenus aranensis]|uniref:RecJ-like exonuclease, contains DnaJ-type Zn finger domain n=1 Tax=Halovenus aranensis TaxID=890420 RepID=A0A1G8XLW6_9EURY|nr:OB-fold nucleic acid binding domain-containing protein [Halovenus aranensis]SDJ90885.1 RecJ-like exonuclease, contains DnaJ-type Zn finger domain [Halovenus aranensis]